MSQSKVQLLQRAPVSLFIVCDVRLGEFVSSAQRNVSSGLGGLTIMVVHLTNNNNNNNVMIQTQTVDVQTHIKLC